MAILQAGDSQRFDHTGAIQQFTVPLDGLYKLEAFGAQGARSVLAGYTSQGGKGGKSTGYALLAQGEVLYVAVGGQGTFYNGNSGGKAGGFNGGGGTTSHSHYDNYTKSTGGGATHVARKDGLLSTLEGYKELVLIVAGGGGGGGVMNLPSGAQFLGNGGDGGGLSGKDGVVGADKHVASGGSQTSGGKGNFNGSFGVGGAASTAYCGAGGGGWYGGAGATQSGGGGGGSGYIGGVPELAVRGITYSPSTESGINTGNGYAVITLIETGTPAAHLGNRHVESITLGTTIVSQLAYGDVIL